MTNNDNRGNRGFRGIILDKEVDFLDATQQVFNSGILKAKQLLSQYNEGKTMAFSLIHPKSADNGLQYSTEETQNTASILQDAATAITASKRFQAGDSIIKIREAMIESIKGRLKDEETSTEITDEILYAMTQKAHDIYPNRQKGRENA